MSGNKKAATPAAPKQQSNNMFNYFSRPSQMSAPVAAKPTVAASSNSSSTAFPSSTPPLSAPALTPTTPSPSPSPASTPLTPQQIATIERNKAEAKARREALAMAAGGASAAPTPATTNVAASFFGNATAIGTPMQPRPVGAAAPSFFTPTKPTAASATTTPPSASSAATPLRSAIDSYSSSGRKRAAVNYAEKSEDESDSERRPVSSQSKKRRSIRDDDDEYEEKHAAASSTDSGDESMHDDDDAYDNEERKVAPRARASGGRAAGSASKPRPAKKRSSGGSAAATTATFVGGLGGYNDEVNRPAEVSSSGKKYSAAFLEPENRMDKKKRRPTDPDYDPRTLYIPDAAWKAMSPAEKQYWELKSERMNEVFLFKIGKFYEMFDEVSRRNCDAAIGVRDLDLQYMTGQARPHAGFPEAALVQKQAQLVALGHRVAVIDQTETPEQLKEWNKTTKGPKRQVVKREVTAVLTPGTLVDAEVLQNPDAQPLLSFIERELSPEERDGLIEQARANGQDGELYETEFAFSIIDCSTGRVIVGGGYDDRQRSAVKTLLGFLSPKETIMPKNMVTEPTKQIFKYDLDQSVAQEERDQSDFWSSSQLINECIRKGYFRPLGTTVASGQAAAAAGSASNPLEHFPPVLVDLINSKNEMCLRAVSGMVKYLQLTMHDHDLLSMRNFVHYADLRDLSRTMGLDGQTLANLEVLRNQDGHLKGTLLEFCDKTKTAFGHRRLRDWLVSPLYSIQAIAERQDAVEALMRNERLIHPLQKALNALPDIERNLARIHAYSLKKQKNIIMYEDVNAKKLNVFLQTVDGLSKIGDIISTYGSEFAEFGHTNRLAKLFTPKSGGGTLPDFQPILEDLKNNYQVISVKPAKIMPRAGKHDEYERLGQQLSKLQIQANDYIRQMRTFFGTSQVQWKHMLKEKYTIEAPLSCKGKVRGNPDFTLQSESKTQVRYQTSESMRLAEEISECEYQRELIARDIARVTYETFSSYVSMWKEVVDAVAELDCLLSLAYVSKHHEGCVRPQFVSHESNGGESFLELRDAKHPALYERALPNYMRQGTTQFIGNDTVIGTADNPKKFILVSGPNMGGKSTLLRQTCCAVILAQVGCWVPAHSMRLTPVDRIFTRVGAFDQIMAGRSTFYVELAETSNILKNATKQSLVILDELGRGTSTYDGVAIAHAVVEYMSREVRCMTLFSTHYIQVIDDFEHDPHIACYHMKCQPDPKKKDVIFLYRFRPGVSRNSYGGVVAKAAGLPDSVVALASRMAQKFSVAVENKPSAAGAAARTLALSVLPPQTFEVVQRALKQHDPATVMRTYKQFAREQAAAAAAATAAVASSDGPLAMEQQ